MRVPLLLLQCVLFLTAEGGSQCGADEIPSQDSGCIKCWKNTPGNPYSVPNPSKTGCVDCEAGEITNPMKSECQCDTDQNFYEGNDGKCVKCEKSEVFEEMSNTCRKCPNGSYPDKKIISTAFGGSDCNTCMDEKEFVRKGYQGFCRSKLEKDLAMMDPLLVEPFHQGTLSTGEYDALNLLLDTLAESNDFAKCTGVCLGKKDLNVQVLKDNGKLIEDAKTCNGLSLTGGVTDALWYNFSWDRAKTEIPDWNGERVTGCVTCSSLAHDSVDFENADASDGKVWYSQFVNPLDKNECKCDVDEIREKGACKKCEDDEVPNNDGTACISCGEGRKRTVIRDKVLGLNTVEAPDLTVVGKAVCECDNSDGAYEEGGLCKVCPLDSILDKANGSDGSTVYSCKKCDLAMGSFPDSNRERCMTCTHPNSEIPSGFLTGMCQVCGDPLNLSLLPKTTRTFRDNENGNYRCTSQKETEANANKCKKGEYTTHIGGVIFEDKSASCLPLCAAERHPKAGDVAPASNVYLKDLIVGSNYNSLVESAKFKAGDTHLRVKFESNPKFEDAHGYGNGNQENPGCAECRKVIYPESFVAGNEIEVGDFLLIGENELQVLDRTGDVMEVSTINGGAKDYDENEPIVHVGFRNGQHRYALTDDANMQTTTDSGLAAGTKEIQWLQTNFQTADFAQMLGVGKEQSADGSYREWTGSFAKDGTQFLAAWKKPVYIRIGNEIMKVLQTGTQGSFAAWSSTPGELLTGTNGSILVEREQLGSLREDHNLGSAIYQLPVSDSLKLGKLERVRLSGQQIFPDKERVSTFKEGENLLLHTLEEISKNEDNPGYKLLNWTAESDVVPYSIMSNVGSGTTLAQSIITNSFLDLPEGLETIHQANSGQPGAAAACAGGATAAGTTCLFSDLPITKDLTFRFKPTRTGRVWVRFMAHAEFSALTSPAKEKLQKATQFFDPSYTKFDALSTCLVGPDVSTGVEIFADRWQNISLHGCTPPADKKYVVLVYIDSDKYTGNGSLETFHVTIPDPYENGAANATLANVFIKYPRITKKSPTGIEFSFVTHYHNTNSKIWAGIVEDGPLVNTILPANITAEMQKTGVPTNATMRLPPFVNGPVGSVGGNDCALHGNGWISFHDSSAVAPVTVAKNAGCSVATVANKTATKCKQTLDNCDLKPGITYRLVTLLQENTKNGEMVTTLGAAFSIPKNVVFANAPANEVGDNIGAKIVIAQEEETTPDVLETRYQIMELVGNQTDVSTNGIRVVGSNFEDFHTGATVSLLRLVLPPYKHAFATAYSPANEVILGIAANVDVEFAEFDSVRLQWTASRLAVALVAGVTTLSLEFNENSCPLLPMLEGKIDSNVFTTGVFDNALSCKKREKEFEEIIVGIGEEYIRVKKYSPTSSVGEDVLVIERAQFGSPDLDHPQNADVRLYEYFDGIANIASASLLRHDRTTLEHKLSDDAQGFVFDNALGYCVKCPPGDITVDNLECRGCSSDQVPNRAKTQCEPCGFEGAVRDPDNKDKCKCEDANHGQDSGLDLQGEQNKSPCQECKRYEYVDSKTNECTTCPLGQYPSRDKKECLPCEDEEIPTFAFDGCQLCGDGVDPANRGKCSGCPARQVLQNSECVQAKHVGNGVDLWIPVTNELDYDVTELGYLQLWEFDEGTGSEAGKAVYKRREDDDILRPVTHQMFSVYSYCGELCSTKNVHLDQVIELYYKDDDLNKVPVCPCEWAQDLKTNDDILQAPGIDAEDGFSVLWEDDSEDFEYKNTAPFRDLRNYFASLKRGNCGTVDPCGDPCEVHSHVSSRENTDEQLNFDGNPLREIVLKKNGQCNLLGVCKELLPHFACKDPEVFAEFLSDDADFATKLTFLIDHYQPLKSGLDTPNNAQLYHQYLGQLSDSLDNAFGRRYLEGATSWFPDVTKLADVYDLNDGDLCVAMPYLFGCSDTDKTAEQQLLSEDCEDLTTDRLYDYEGAKRGCAVILNFGPTNPTAEKVRKTVLSQLELNVSGDLDAWKDSTGGYPMQKVFDMQSRSKIFDTVVDSDGARDLSDVDSTDTEFIKKYQEVWVAYNNRELKFFFDLLVKKAQLGEKWGEVITEASTAWNSPNLNKTFWINLLYSLSNDADVQNLEVSKVILILAVFFKIYPYEEYQLPETSEPTTTLAPRTCADYFDVNVNSKTCFEGYDEKANFDQLLIQGDDFGAILHECCDWADNTSTGAKSCSDWLTGVNGGVCFDGYEEVVGATCNAGLCKFDECCEHSDASTSSSTSGSPTATTTTEVLLDIDLGTESSVMKEGSKVVEGPNGATGIADYYLRTEITHKIRISKIMSSYCALIGPPEGAASAMMYNSQIVYDEIQPVQLPIGEGNLSQLELDLFGTQIGGKKEIAKVHLQPGCTFKSDDPNHKNISEVFAFSMNAHMNIPMEFSSFVADVGAEVDSTLTPVLMKRSYSCSCEPTITSTLKEIKNTFVDILTTYEVLDEPLSKKITVWVYGLAGLPENTITIITDKSSITEQKVVQDKWVKKQIEIKDFSNQMVVTASKQFQNQKFLFYSQTASKGYVENPGKSCKVGENDLCVFLSLNTFSHADSATEPIKASYQITQLNMQEEVVEKYFHGAFNEELLEGNRFDANGNKEANTSGASSFTKFGSFVLTLLF